MTARREKRTAKTGAPGTGVSGTGVSGTGVSETGTGTGTAGTRTANWYARSPEVVAAAFGVDPATGLPAAKAAELLAKNGPNALPEEKPEPGWTRLLAQYRSYMQIILVAAVVVSLAIQEWGTAVLLVVLTLVNAVIGMRQEGKAESAMNALKSMMKATARVRRDGTEAEIPAEEVVVGDVVLIAAGDEVPADGRIVAASALQIDESALTGESTPAAKDAGTLSAGRSGADRSGLAGRLGPGDQTNMAFMNTPVTHGSGTVVVTGTGSGTELGKISGMLSATEREESPLTKELNRLTLWIAGAAGLTMVVMFVLGRARGEAWDALFVAAVSLAIAAIPEALPTVTQTILSLGGVDLAKRNAIVKDLPSVETLGFTSAINSDKTGTLTMNQMTAVEVIDPGDRYTISGIGYGLDGKVHHAAGSSPSIEDAVLPYLVANDAKLVNGEVVGDPTEGALLVLAHKAGLDPDATLERLPRLATLPFDPTYKLMATFNSATDAAGEPVVRCFVKGAAPALLSRAATALSGGAEIPWDKALDERAQEHVERMGAAGRRVMAAATRDLDPATFDAAGDLLGYVTDLRMTSLVGMVDPPRDSSRAAVADAQAAHIRVRMVTGDDVVTGAAIAEQVGIKGEAILGADFAALSEAERLARIDDIGVVGRVAPEHKVLLADTLKKKGEVVAMTGDGVNDAPAIKAADIGIAMGSGTEVAKNAGRMILSDDDFASIVFAVEQGRKIYDNLAKYVRFVLVLLVVFVLTFLGATLFNIAAGEPFTPAQVLWVHFVVNAAFGFALGFDRESPGLMARRPRPRGEPLMTTGVMVTVGLAGLAISIGLLLMIKVGEWQYGSLAIGNSIAFTAFALCLIVAAVECRNETETALTTATFDSKHMNWTMLGEFALAVAATQMDGFQRLLGTTELDLGQFGWALVPALALLALWETGKLTARTLTADSPTSGKTPDHEPTDHKPTARGSTASSSTGPGSSGGGSAARSIGGSSAARGSSGGGLAGRGSSDGGTATRSTGGGATGSRSTGSRSTGGRSTGRGSAGDGSKSGGSPGGGSKSDGSTERGSTSDGSTSGESTGSGSAGGGPTSGGPTGGGPTGGGSASGGSTSSGSTRGGPTSGGPTGGGSASGGSASGGSAGGGATSGGSTSGASTGGGYASGGSESGAPAGGGSAGGGSAGGGATSGGPLGGEDGGHGSTGQARDEA
ncbi:HAD-IC family P-type ATPase [Spirillospora sp. NPDC048911]|uniref:cation-translocating P-type ATPase n=1 Tax=Spirillospora sp. NPDC048911 TaxID=3364527 RepID=UPI0037163869